MDHAPESIFSPPNPNPAAVGCHLDRALPGRLGLKWATGDHVRVEGEMAGSLIKAVADVEDAMPPRQPHRLN